MRRAVIIVLLIGFTFFISGCSPQITPEEAKVLVVLGEIQRGAESNIRLEQCEHWLNTAKAEINILEQNSQQNPCFMNAVKKCYASYAIARKAWKKKEAEKNAKRKEDMEMTMSFSMSISALNVKKANNCYQ